MSSRINQIDKDELQKVLDSSTSYSDVLKKLGLSRTGYQCNELKRKIKDEELSEELLNKNRTSKYCCHKKIPLEKILIECSSYTWTSNLKGRLIKEKVLEEKCCICKISPIWNGKTLSLQLDHINGKRNDNRLENLRLLCPNCHSQTDTYAGKNQNRQRKIWKCKKCDDTISVASIHCIKCVEYNVPERKFDPSKEELEELLLVKKMSYVSLGKKYGVSGNSIKKRAKLLGIKVKIRRPPKGQSLKDNS